MSFEGNKLSTMQGAPRSTIGQALLAAQYIKAFFIFAAIYVLFNPSMIPEPVYPLRQGVERLHVVIASVLGGPWYLIVGKLLAVIICVYSGFVEMRSQKEKLEMRTEAQREDEIRARMRKARKASQQRLNELIEEESRRQQEADDAAMADQLSRVEGRAEDNLAKSGHHDKARGDLQSRVQSAAVHAAAVETSEQKMKYLDAALKIKERPAVAPTNSSFVGKLQGELDQALAQDTPLSFNPTADKAKQDDRQGKKESFVEKMQSEVDQALVSAQAPLSSFQPPADKVKQDDKQKKNKESFVEKMQSELDQALLAQRSSPAARPPPGSSSGMIPLSEAREAEERQLAWLQQLSEQVVDGPARARAATLEAERRLREEQEEEYRQSLAADEARMREFEREREEAELTKAREKEAEEEARMNRQAREERRKEELAELPEEPAADEGVVVVRVRLIKGAVHQRRFLASSMVAEVVRWVGFLDEVPELGKWKLVTSFPRSEPHGDSTVAEVACGAGAIAFFVEV